MTCLSSGLLLLFSTASINFELFNPCIRCSKSFSSNLLLVIQMLWSLGSLFSHILVPPFLKCSLPFLGVCSFFSYAPASLERLTLLLKLFIVSMHIRLIVTVITIVIVIVLVLIIGGLLLLKRRGFLEGSSPFRAVCSWVSKAL